MAEPRFKSAADINLLDADTQEHCYDAYEVLLRDAPVVFMPELGMYVVSRYADIDEIVKDNERFINDYSDDSAHPLLEHPESRKLYAEKGWERLMPLSGNQPHHRAYRALVNPFLTAQAVRKREDLILGAINELIDAWIDKGEIEFLADFSEPLPMIVIAEALGFPRIDLPRLKRWSGAWAAPFGRGLTVEEEVAAVELHIEFQHYIHQTIVQKRAAPTDDVISSLVHGDFDDPDTGEKRKLTDAEIIGISDHLLTGGNETTTYALSSGLWLLFRYPHLWDELKADRSKIRIFVEEALRVESPTQGMARVATVDTEIGGVPIPKGAAIHIRYGAANRDERRFPKPEVPDLSRRNAASHFAFGGGDHVCPGGALSRLEQTLAWGVMLDRIERFRPLEDKNDYLHLPGLWPRALRYLHVGFERA